MVAMKKSINCCDTTAKILLVGFNCIFWAIGVAILGVGIWLKTDSMFANLGQAIKVGNNEPVVEIVTWLFIGAGIFVFAVGVVGIIGIIRESKIMIGFYLVCVFIVFAAEAGAGVYAGIRRDYIIEQIEEEGSVYIKKYYTSDPSKSDYAVSTGFNYVQVEYKCCGVKDFMDYHNSTYLEELGSRVRANASLSWACCNTETDLDEAFRGDGMLTIDAESRVLCMADSAKATETYLDPLLSKDDAAANAKEECSNFKDFNCQIGCVDELVLWTEKNMIVLVAVAAAVAGCQLILLLLVLWFCQSLGAEEK